MTRRLLWLAVLTHFVAAVCSLGHNHPDEYHQILGFAAYKLGALSEAKLPWEFPAHMRPALQPAIIVVLVRIGRAVGLDDPFAVATLSRVLSAALSLWSVTLFLGTTLGTLSSVRLQRWTALATVFGYLAVYNGVRFSSETWSGDFLLAGFALAILPRPQLTRWSMLTSGVLLGLASVTRFQAAFAVVGLLTWLLWMRRPGIGLAGWLLVGIALSAIAGLALDRWLYGEWVITPWDYFVENILRGKAASFGESSALFYLAVVAFVPLGPLYVLGAIGIWTARPRDPLPWTVVPFVLAHVVVGHKELRFLVPILGFMPLAAAHVVEYLAPYSRALRETIAAPTPRALIRWGWSLNCIIVTGVMVTPSAAQLPLNRAVYTQNRGPTTFYHITEGGHILEFYKRPSLAMVKIARPDDARCRPHESCLIALTCREVRATGFRAPRIIYSNCPTWLSRVNVNGWQERSALYNVYDISAP